MGALLGQESRFDEPYRPLSVLSEVLSRIQTDYVEDPNFSRVTEGALHGLLESLDPYSSYLSPEEYREYQKVRGTASIGAAVTKRSGIIGAGIVSVIPGGPAHRAGLESGDILEAIDGISTQEMSYAELVRNLEGDPGSTVKLSVIRGTPEPQAFELRREVIRAPEIEARLLEPGIGYLKVQALPAGEAQKIAGKMRELRGSGARKFVLDLRDDTTGEISEGFATANLFIRRGLLGYAEGQQHPRQNFTAEESKAISEEPLAVLVNEATGGAAEIVAAAVLDTHRGDVVGARTFGIGVIQKTIPLDDGAALILSIAKYYSPSGKAIPDNGVTPNVVVLEPRQFVATEDGEPAPPSPPREDTQLKRAIELLRNQEASPQAA
jgi:carboxyl-terminal processing protease